MDRKDSAEHPSQQLAEALWQRFKELVLVRQRLEDFVFHPEAESVEKVHGQLESLSRDQEQLRLIARELTLRAFRVAVEADNFKILLLLKEERSVSMIRLSELTGLPELVLGEKVNDLVQIGVASRSLETNEVRATPLADSLMELFEDTAGELARHALERLPGIVSPDPKKEPGQK